MSTTSIGRQVEAAVARHLETKGYKIVEQNWRTRWCEIDLIMKKGETVYFVEVKFRKSSTVGEGVEYITPKKLQQMYYAAEFWISANKWDAQSELMVASVDGASSTIKLLSLD